MKNKLLYAFVILLVVVFIPLLNEWKENIELHKRSFVVEVDKSPVTELLSQSSIGFLPNELPSVEQELIDEIELRKVRIIFLDKEELGKVDSKYEFRSSSLREVLSLTKERKGEVKCPVVVLGSRKISTNGFVYPLLLGEKLIFVGRGYWPTDAKYAFTRIFP